jgi:hypothetical protein
MAGHISVKRLQIDKANTSIVIAVGIAAFALTFALVSARSLISKQSYQNKVVEQRELARDQLNTNIAAVDDLKTKYAEFVSRPENIIKGNSAGTGERDGDNGRIVLDALPSKYDFPALVSSLEKILTDRNYKITTITGVDEEVLQNGTQQATAGAPLPGQAPTTTTTTPVATTPTATAGSGVTMPFEVGAEGSYPSLINLLKVFGSSIRPLQVQSLVFTASEGSGVQLNIKGFSYYQPERTLEVKEEVVQ